MEFPRCRSLRKASSPPDVEADAGQGQVGEIDQPTEVVVVEDPQDGLTHEDAHQDVSHHHGNLKTSAEKTRSPSQQEGQADHGDQEMGALGYEVLEHRESGFLLRPQVGGNEFPQGFLQVAARRRVHFLKDPLQVPLAAGVYLTHEMLAPLG